MPQALAGCFDDQRVAALIAGTLPGNERVLATAHLDECNSCRDLVAEAALASGSEATGFRIDREVARGAMGRIVAARDLRLHRDVVLKQLIDPSPALRARFAREITITAALQHPGIVPVYQAGSLGDGEPFYAMRRVNGRALDVVIAEATTTAARVALVPRVLAAVEAVAYAHSQGVIHRDLKPHNILVGEFGEVVVVDWGLGKRLSDPDDPAGTDPSSDANPTQTRDGTVLGTPAYMAPEQAAGAAADQRSDVYALGAVLFHVLSGKPPRTGTSITAVIESARQGAAVSLAALTSVVPVDLIAIVERALAPDPADRYVDAAALASDVRDFLAGRLVAAHAYTRPQLVRRWLARYRAWVAAGALAVVLTATVATASFMRIRAERDRASALQAASEVLVGYMLEELRPPLEGLGKLAILESAGSQVDAYYGRVEAQRTLSADMHVRRGSALILLGDVSYDRGDLESAQRLFERARTEWQRARKLAPDLALAAEKLAAAHDRLGDVAREQGRTDAAREAFTAGLAIRQALRAPDHRGLGISYLKLADLRLGANELDEAIDGYRKAKDEFAAVAGPEPSHEVGVALVRIGVVETSRGDFAAAETAFVAALATAEARLAAKPGDPQRIRAVAMAQTQVGGAQADRGEFEAALATYGRARDLHASLVSTDPDNAVWRGSLAEQWGHLGATHLALDREADAVAAFSEEVALREALAAGDPTDVTKLGELAFAHYHVGLGENRMHRLDRAVGSLTRATELGAKVVAAKPEDADAAIELTAAYDALADTERDRGRHPAAAAAIDRALAITGAWRAKRDASRWVLREADLHWNRSRIARAAGDGRLEIEALQAAQARFRSVATAEQTAFLQAVSAEVDARLGIVAGR